MTISYNRRRFLQQSATVVAGCTAASLWTPQPPLLAFIGNAREPLPPIEDPRLKALVERALDASTSAGAIYADVRLTHSYTRRTGGNRVSDVESMTVGVRALTDGYWGFASGPVWSPDEMVRLGREAVLQAKANAFGKPRETLLAPTPVVQGHWTTPIGIDPFSVHPAEVSDRTRGVEIYATLRPEEVTVIYNWQAFERLEKAFGSSEGSYCTQRSYLTNGLFQIGVSDGTNGGSGTLDFLDPEGVGFEMFEESRMRAGVDRLIEDIKTDWALPVQPVDVGRYDLVLGARPVAQLLSGTIGAATELDRMLGYEANATGTSYLNDPFEMLGTLQLGASQFTVTMNRNEAGGAATMRWDDEGVVPESVTLIKDGIVNDVQTTREGAGWLHAWSTQHGRPFRSTGAAFAASGYHSPVAHTGNLVLVPGNEPHTVDTLVAQVEDGVLFTALEMNLDFQQVSGMGKGVAFQLRHGKKVARLDGAGILFRAPELWKSLKTLGGASSAKRSAMFERKGQPTQQSVHSITAVPALFTQQTVIDVRRKA